MLGERVERLFFGLVALAKTHKVRGHNPAPGGFKDRDHVPVLVTPRGWAVQAKVGQRGITRADIQVMQAQSVQTR